ncbi:MAG: T9SS type A sorting domain-containing protein [Bacteroidota bacterium]
MKKTTLTILASAAFILANAQCAKFVLLEEFTQASCGPCASQNPGFKTNILDPNPDKVRLVAYHTSWPGTDPMYSYNTTDNGGRTTYYSVTGVPYVVMMGNQQTGSPSSFTQTAIDNEWNETSPIKITVTEVDNGNNRDVTIEIKSVGAPPSGSYNLVIPIVERNVQYTSPPGTNGETYFPCVFRDMLGTTQTNGIPVTLPTQGNSITMGPYNYLESIAIFNASELAPVAFLQNTATKQVIQVGTPFDPTINAVMFAPTTLVKEGLTAQTFTFSSGNSGNTSETFNYTLTASGAPVGWTAGFTVNGTPFTSSGSMAIPANTNYPTTITVTPNASPGVGKYTLSMTSQSNPSAPAMVTTVYVISGVTDLIVNNTSGFGATSISGTAANYEPQFIAGLQFAGNTAYAATDAWVCERAIMDGAMTNVKNLYMNMAWTFPTLTDGLVAQLTTFLNTSGKCMFICGQDIAWETMDAASTYDTPNTQAFFTNYLNASYVGDGSTANTQLTVNSSDAIFGTSGPHPISTTVPYTSTYFFPDEINAAGIGTVIYYYNGNVNKKAGVRATNGTYKVVYLCPGIEQLTNTSSKNAILKLAHDWFWGLSSTEAFDQSMIALSMGQNYPNPAASITYIPVENIEKDMMIQVVDLTGRVVYEQAVSAGTELIILNTGTLEAGMYLYRLVDGNAVIKAKQMQVVH